MKYILATLSFFIILAASPQVFAQDDAAQKVPLYKMQELEQLVAPIALYPDNLLSQVLIASTYPLEIVEADRWAAAHKNMSADELAAALAQKKWDDSIKALVSTPEVLSNMSNNLEATQKLGDAILSQQDDVMTAVQHLRAKAYAQKSLASNTQQTVSVEQSGSDQVIIIEPAQQNIVYVPYYDPTVVYGGWPYPSALPYYYPPPPSYAFLRGLAFGAGVAIAANLWDDDMNWGGGSINVNVNKNFITDIHNRHPGYGRGQRWEHNPEHRRGVPYADKALDRKYSPERTQRATSRDMHNDFRGRLAKTDQRALQRPDVSTRPQRTGMDRASQAGPRRDLSAANAGRSNRSAFSGIGNSGRTHMESMQGRSSFQQSHSFGSRGGFQGGGGNFRGGGGGGFRGGGGGRR